MNKQVTKEVTSQQFIDAWTRYFCSTSVMNEQFAVVNLHMLIGQASTIYDHANRLKLIDKFSLKKIKKDDDDDDNSDPNAEMNIPVDEMGGFNAEGLMDGELPAMEGEEEETPDYSKLAQSDLYLPLILRFHGNYYDLRTHANYIQDSGTGKSEANTQVMAVGTVLGLDIKKITITTDAGLIGDNENQAGVLTKSEIIMVDEAQEFYADSSKLSKDKAKVRDVLNEAMNVAGTYMSVITKELKHEDYQVYPLSSFILTSYETENMFALAQSTGFFQRSLTYNRELDYEEYMLMQNLHTRGMYLDPKTKKERTYTRKMKQTDEDIVFPYFTKIKKFLSTIGTNKVIRTVIPDKTSIEGAKFYIPVRLIELTSEDNMKLRDLTIQSVLRFSTFYEDLVEGLSDEIKKYTKTFFSRMKGHMLRLSLHHAIMNFRVIPTTKDYTYGQIHAQTYMRNIVEWVERWSEKDHSISEEAEQREKHDNEFVAEFNKLNEYYIRRLEFSATKIDDLTDKVRTYVEYLPYFDEITDSDSPVPPAGFEGYFPLSHFKKFMVEKIQRSPSTIEKKWSTAKKLFMSKTQKPSNTKWIRPKETPAGDMALNLNYEEEEALR